MYRKKAVTSPKNSFKALLFMKKQHISLNPYWRGLILFFVVKGKKGEKPYNSLNKGRIG